MTVPLAVTEVQPLQTQEPLGGGLSQTENPVIPSGGLTVNPSQPPAAPSGLSASASGTSITLTWTDNDPGNEDGYEVWRKTAKGSYAKIWDVQTGIVKAMNIIDNKQLQPGTTYTYKIRTYNSAGYSAFSNEASATTSSSPAGPTAPATKAVPNGPSNLKASAITGGTAVQLSWIDNSANEEGFRIERKETGGGFAQVGATGKNTPAFVDNGKPGKNYTYRVKAYNFAGDSAYSNEASATTSSSPAGPVTPTTQPPTEPSGLKAAAISPEAVELTWKDNCVHEEGFIIERQDKGSGFVKVGDTLSNVTVFIDAGLDPGAVYSYRVKAYNNAGESPCSNESIAKTMTSPGLPQPHPEPGESTVLRFIIGSRESFVNDQFREIDVEPVIREGRTLLPIRFVAEPLGTSAGWNASDQKATVTLGNKVIELWVGKNRAMVNGKEESIDPNNPNVVPIVLPPGRTMLPLRFVTETLGCKVEWDDKTETVTITSEEDDSNSVTPINLP